MPSLKRSRWGLLLTALFDAIIGGDVLDGALEEAAAYA